MGTFSVVGVSGVGGNIAQGIVKGLRTRPGAFRIIGLDALPDNVGFHMVDRGVIMPRIGEPRYVDALMTALREHRVELYLMGVDVEIRVVSALRGYIEQETACQVVVSDDAFVQRATDKLSTAEMLTELALPAAKTLPGDTVFGVAAEQLGLPFLVKPRRGHGARGVRLIKSTTDLDEQMPRVGASHCFQEYLPGDEYTCALLYDRNGSLRDWVCFQRRLQYGMTMEARVVTIEALNGLIRRFGERRRCVGPINLQIRQNREGTHTIFEINPRFSGTTAFRVACGFNDPLRVALHYLRDEPIDPVPVRRVQIFRFFDEWVVSS
jgi:carbamoyl-phosphate synthase large subunit